MSRGEATDAYDLWWHWTQVLDGADRARLPGLIKKKLATGRPLGDDLLVRFEEMRESAEHEWTTGKGLILTAAKPEWSAVTKVLNRYKALIPHKVV